MSDFHDRNESMLESRRDDLYAVERVLNVLYNSTFGGTGAKEVATTLNVLEPIKEMIEMDIKRLEQMLSENDDE